MAGLAPVDPTAPTLRPIMSGGAPAAAATPAVPVPAAPAAPPVQSAAAAPTWAQTIFGATGTRALGDAAADYGQGSGLVAAGDLARAGAIATGRAIAAPVVGAGAILGTVGGAIGSAAGQFGRGLFGLPAAPAVATPAAAAAVVPAVPAIERGKGLYGYDPATGPTVAEAQAIQADQARRYGHGLPAPVAAAASPAASPAAAGPAITQGSPASQTQPAQPGHSQIPIALLPEYMAAAQGMQRVNAMRELAQIHQQSYNEALTAAGTNTSQIEKARLLRTNQILQQLNPPNLEQSAIYGGLSAP